MRKDNNEPDPLGVIEDRCAFCRHHKAFINNAKNPQWVQKCCKCGKIKF